MHGREARIKNVCSSIEIKKKIETGSLYIPQGGNSVSAPGVAGIMGTS